MVLDGWEAFDGNFAGILKGLLAEKWEFFD